MMQNSNGGVFRKASKLYKLNALNTRKFKFENSFFFQDLESKV